MNLASYFPDGPLGEQSTPYVRFVSQLSVLIGAILHIVFYTGPPIGLAASVLFLGGGLATYSFISLYQNQPRMTPSHLVPYLVGVVMAVAIIAVGIGYGYVDRRVGLPFLAVLAGTLLLFARYFTYEPEHSGSGLV